MIFSCAKSNEVLKKAANDRITALSDYLGISLVDSEADEMAKIQLNYEQLLQKNFKMTRAEAQRLMDSAMDVKHKESRTLSRRLAGRE